MTGVDECRSLLAEWLHGGHTADLRTRTKRCLAGTDPGAAPSGFVVARFVDEGRLELWEADVDRVAPTYRSVTEAEVERDRAGADPESWPVFALVESGGAS